MRRSPNRTGSPTNTKRVNFTPTTPQSGFGAHSSLNDLILARNRSFGNDETQSPNLSNGKNNKNGISSSLRISNSNQSRRVTSDDLVAARPSPLQFKGKSRSYGSLRTQRPMSASNLSMTSTPYPTVISVPIETTKSLDDHELYWIGRGKKISTHVSPSVITTHRSSAESQSSSNDLNVRSHQAPTATTTNIKSLQLQKDPLIQSNQQLPIMYYSSLGDIYSNSNAMKAYKTKQLNSKSVENSKNLRIIFVNDTSKPLILCWVGFDHKLHHYYKLNPTGSTTIIGGMGSTGYQNTFLDTRLQGGLHTEHSYLGHTFVLGLPPKDENLAYYEKNNPKDSGYHYYDENTGNDSLPCWIPFKQDNNKVKLDKSKIQTIVGAYRPMHLGMSSKDDDELKEAYCVHLITITEELAFLPNAKVPSIPQIVFHLTARQCRIDDTPLDTSDKEYVDMFMGGWRVRYEKGFFVTKDGAKVDKDSNIETFLQKFESDLVAAKKKLPSHAYKILKKTTPFWVNKSQYYGPKAAPVRGRGACFHPGKSWLIENGMSDEKCGGIELYEANAYVQDCDHWHGQGGVLIHELSHAL